MNPLKASQTSYIELMKSWIVEILGLFNQTFEQMKKLNQEQRFW
jgi:hypothetical protein